MKLDRTDRKILIAVLAMLAVLIGVAALAPPQEEDGPNQIPSSYSATSGGAKAAYLLLQQLGYNVQRWEQSPSALPNPGAGYTLVLLSPTEFTPKAEHDALQHFLETGGRVLVDGWGGYLMPRSKSVPAFNMGSLEEFKPMAPSRLNTGVRPISMAAAQRWSPQEMDVVPAYGDSLGAVVVQYPVKNKHEADAADDSDDEDPGDQADKAGAILQPDGEVVWWAAATPLTNSGLREAGNLELFLNSIGDKDSTRVLWDEYFHGSRGGRRSMIRGTPVPWALLQLGLLMLAGMLTFSRRSGPVHDYQDPPRLSPLEFVHTLGNLYRRANGNEVAVQAALQRFRLLLSRRLGTQPNATPQQIYTALETRFNFRDDEFVNVMLAAERAAKASEVNPKDALQLVRKLQQYSLDLKLTPTHGE
jgi:hypothetical protein